MSCVREGSAEPPYRPPRADQQRNGSGRTTRFLRGLRRMFKRRSGRHDDQDKSCSTSELIDADTANRRKEGAYGSGLSVSHDSVFTGERSGDDSSDERPPGHGTQFASSHRAELVAAVRRRGGRGDASDDDEDLGLPRSPPASPPTDKADKRHHAGISQSSCSDGSLLSVGSSEMDDDSNHDHSNRSDNSDFYNSSEPPTGVAPLSHSAARHKMAVRPRRTHGAPRRNKNNAIASSALPITPELNEEMIRNTTPEVVHSTSSEVVTESFSSTTTTKHQIVVKEQHQHINKEIQRVIDTPKDTKLKSSSLPPGLALSQLVGQTPTKLSIAEANTPRSSIKRSKSSSQGKSLRDDVPKTQGSTSESQIYQDEKRQSKYANETCLVDKKSKSDKKIENDKTKKEESFFSRLLLRKSGKKSKKETNECEPAEAKKKTEKPVQQYKSVDTEGSGFIYHSYAQKPVPAERNITKSAGQKVFSNQMHKRIDNKGSYAHESVYKDAYSAAAKITGVEYITDLKVAEETDRILNGEMKHRYSRHEEFTEKLIERSRWTSSKENVDEGYRRDSFNFQGHERSKKMIPSQKNDPFLNKPFNNELPKISISKEEPPVAAPRMRSSCNDFVFHSGSMPKNIPFFNPNIIVSASVSPPKSVLNTENLKHLNRSSEQMSDYGRERNMFEGKCEHDCRRKKTEESYKVSSKRTRGDEYLESKGSIGKSHSFRYASETPSISSQESQMPSLPAIVGISEPLLESWEVNYRRNVTSESFSGRHDYSKRISARNYNIQHGNSEAYDSLQSTDSSYLDSLKTESHSEEKTMFANTIHINVDSNKRNSDISQIEAKIDDIISSPKPLIASILKSSSLDSVKSSPEKTRDDRRKTISVESSILQNDMPNYTQKEVKNDNETFVSVTHINNENAPLIITEQPKLTKSDEKLQRTGTSKPGVPEFLKIQLNRVDAKPTTNVVLTANLTPKKNDVAPEKNNEIDNIEVVETKSQQLPARKEPKVVKNLKENLIDEVEVKKSPVILRKCATQVITPQSPSTPKTFFKRKSISVDLQEKFDKSRTNSVSTEGSTERIFDNISMEQKSHSIYGSKSSIQSSDSNEIRTPDRHEETVIYRKKTVALVKERSGKKNDDEPELMKVFARRSLKLKDSEAETLAQEIAEHKTREENDNAAKTKMLKNEFNASIKSRDSDKENDDKSDDRVIDIAARVSQFGVPHYQRSVSITNVTANVKRDSAPVSKSEVNKYKKEVSDFTPEKRLRNRTFPDPTNDREDIKNLAKTDAYKADTLSKRPWQKKDEVKNVEKIKTESVIERDDIDKDEIEKDENSEADGSPQFKGILQMRAEWERRAKQGMTK